MTYELDISGTATGFPFNPRPGFQSGSALKLTTSLRLTSCLQQKAKPSAQMLAHMRPGLQPTVALFLGSAKTPH